jgi:hypothetical protein
MRAYTLIEPDIGEKLNWDLDLIVKCLEVIRIKMPQILPQAATGTEYDLIAVGNPQGSPYPAIGVYCPEESDWVTLPDWPQINDITNQWIQKLDFDRLREKAVDAHYIDWNKLTSLGTFPTRTEKNTKE